jgi:hypothetical protein
MDQSELNQRCVDLFFHPRVLQHMWHARMFWDIGSELSPKPTDLSKPKVDLQELEVLLCAAAYEESQCADDLNAREPGRADFIRRAVQSGQRPLLHHAD